MFMAFVGNTFRQIYMLTNVYVGTICLIFIKTIPVTLMEGNIDLYCKTRVNIK